MDDRLPTQWLLGASLASEPHISKRFYGGIDAPSPIRKWSINEEKDSFSPLRTAIEYMHIGQKLC